MSFSWIKGDTWNAKRIQTLKFIMWLRRTSTFLCSSSDIYGLMAAYGKSAWRVRHDCLAEFVAPSKLQSVQFLIAYHPHKQRLGVAEIVPPVAARWPLMFVKTQGVDKLKLLRKCNLGPYSLRK